jgi:hypothetical protein
VPKLTPTDTTAYINSTEGPGGGTLENEALSGFSGGKAPAGTRLHITGTLNVTAIVPSAGTSECWGRFQYWTGSGWTSIGPVAHATQSGAGSDNDTLNGPWLVDISGIDLTGFKIRAQIEWTIAGAGNTAQMTASATDWWVVIPVPGIMEA